MKMKLERELKGLLKSFSFAFRGIKKSIMSERNMRIHVTAAAFLLIFSYFYHFSRVEYALLFLAISSVIATEMMNTAVEAVVDMVSPAYSRAAQVAKDIAAGAVFVSAIFSVGVGLLLYLDFSVMTEIFQFFIANPLLIISLACAVAIGIMFIFKGAPRHSSKVRPKNK